MFTSKVIVVPLAADPVFCSPETAGTAPLYGLRLCGSAMVVSLLGVRRLLAEKSFTDNFPITAAGGATANYITTIFKVLLGIHGACRHSLVLIRWFVKPLFGRDP